MHIYLRSYQTCYAHSIWLCWLTVALLAVWRRYRVFQAGVAFYAGRYGGCLTWYSRSMLLSHDLKNQEKTSPLLAIFVLASSRPTQTGFLENQKSFFLSYKSTYQTCSSQDISYKFDLELFEYVIEFLIVISDFILVRLLLIFLILKK